MSELGRLIHLLHNIPVRELISALERDGFRLKRSTKTGARIYSDGDRIVVVHYHHSSDTLTRKTLGSFLSTALRINPRRLALVGGRLAPSETHQVADRWYN